MRWLLPAGSPAFEFGPSRLPVCVRWRPSEEVIAVARFDERVVGDRLVPALHAAVEDEARRDVRRLLDVLPRRQPGVERVAILHDDRDVDPGRAALALGPARLARICALV